MTAPPTLSQPLSFRPPTVGPSSLATPAFAPSLAPPDAPDFAGLLSEAIGQVNQNAHAADGLSTRAILGEDVTQAEVFSAVKKADLSLRMLISVRNKLLEGWKELQSLPV